MDWSVYDLMMSQLSGDGGVLSRASASAPKSIIWRSSRPFSTRCRRRPRRTSTFPLSAPCRRITGSGSRCSRPSPNVTISNCSATRPQALPASSPLHRCFQGEVWGADMYQVLRRSTHHAQLPHRHGRPGSRKHAAVRGDRRRRFSADRFQGQSAHAVRAGSRGRGLALDRRLPCGASSARSRDDEGRAEIARAGQARTMAQHTYRHRAAEILGFVEAAAGAAMKLPRIVRQIGKRVVKATPILRRHILTSTDYRVLGGIDEARSADGFVGRMACRAHGGAAGARLSRPDRRHEARRTAARFQGRGRSHRGHRDCRIPACSRSAAAAATIRKCLPRCFPAACATPASTIPTP